MTTFGIRLISGAYWGTGPGKAHGTYAEAVIELEHVTGTVPALVAASSDAWPGSAYVKRCCSLSSYS